MTNGTTATTHVPDSRGQLLTLITETPENHLLTLEELQSATGISSRYLQFLMRQQIAAGAVEPILRGKVWRRTQEPVGPLGSVTHTTVAPQVSGRLYEELLALGDGTFLIEREDGLRFIAVPDRRKRNLAQDARR